MALPSLLDKSIFAFASASNLIALSRLLIIYIDCFPCAQIPTYFKTSPGIHRSSSPAFESSNEIGLYLTAATSTALPRTRVTKNDSNYLSSSNRGVQNQSYMGLQCARADSWMKMKLLLMHATSDRYRGSNLMLFKLEYASCWISSSINWDARLVQLYLVPLVMIFPRHDFAQNNLIRFTSNIIIGCSCLWSASWRWIVNTCCFDRLGRISGNLW